MRDAIARSYGTLLIDDRGNALLDRDSADTENTGAVVARRIVQPCRDVGGRVRPEAVTHGAWADEGHVVHAERGPHAEGGKHRRQVSLSIPLPFFSTTLRYTSCTAVQYGISTTSGVHVCSPIWSM